MGSRESEPISISSADSDTESNMGSRESESISISSADSDTESKMLIKRGPGIQGNLPFDKHGVFGNTMWLNQYQVEWINNVVQSIKGPYSNSSAETSMIKRGPAIRGKEPFDKHCIFGNVMWLNPAQVEQLNDLVQECPGKPIKYYVYMMTASSVDRKKGKMEFRADFTKASLRRYLQDPIQVPVESNDEACEVQLKMALCKKKAIMCCGWTNALVRYNLEAGAYVIFAFYPNKRNKLFLELIQMD